MARSHRTTIPTTISRDSAAGYIAEQEKNLQGFVESGQVGQIVRDTISFSGTLSKQLQAFPQAFPQPVRYSYQQALRIQQRQQREQHQQQQQQQQVRQTSELVQKQTLKVRFKKDTDTSAAQQMAAKRSRISTQARKSLGDSTSATRTRKSQRKRVRGYGASIEHSNRTLQQNPESRATALVRGAIPHEVTDLDASSKTSVRNRKHASMMTSHI